MGPRQELPRPEVRRRSERAQRSSRSPRSPKEIPSPSPTGAPAYAESNQHQQPNNPRRGRKSRRHTGQTAAIQRLCSGSAVPTDCAHGKHACRQHCRKQRRHPCKQHSGFGENEEAQFSERERGPAALADRAEARGFGRTDPIVGSPSAIDAGDAFSLPPTGARQRQLISHPNQTKTYSSLGWKPSAREPKTSAILRLPRRTHPYTAYLYREWYADRGLYR